MTRVEVHHETKVAPTGRLQQIAGSLDLEDPSRSEFRASVDVDLDEYPWSIGAIVGPSGAGKTSVARQLWPDHLAHEPDWPGEVAVADAFPEHMTGSEIADVLTRMGLASVPTWIRPYQCLSNGEQFRADMARLVSADDPLTVIDEFTSLVDRTVARATAHTTAKAIRQREGRQLVAVTCHYDVLDWLQPDWIVDMATGTFTWRSVQPRPGLDFTIHAADRRAWPVFAPHHYLDHALPSGCTGHIWVGYVDSSPATFFAARKFPHPKARNMYFGSRMVTLPDFQGFGLNFAMVDWVGQRYAEGGQRLRIPTSHPGVQAALARSPRWRLASSRQTVNPGAGSSVALRSEGLWRRLKMRTFEYQPPTVASRHPR